MVDIEAQQQEKWLNTNYVYMGNYYTIEWPEALWVKGQQEQA